MLRWLLAVLLVFGTSTLSGAQEIGSNQFGFDLYRVLAGKPGNLAFSPFSISTALAMTSAAARGETARQFSQVLHLPDRPHQAYHDLLERLLASPQDYTLSLANRLWPSQNLQLSPAFRDLLTSQYRSQPWSVDFGQSEKTRAQINEWVAQQTQDKIKELLAPDAIDSSTVLVLTNALYFKANWQRAFDPKDTEQAPFGRGADRVTCHLMRTEGVFPYYHSGSADVLELPYRGGRLSMVVVLPLEGQTLGEVNLQRWREWLAGLQETHIVVRLPRFKVQAGLNLPPTLKALGLDQLFGPGCDLSGATVNAENMFISEVVHQVCLEVDEVGSEGAAATAVVSTRSLPPCFMADRPFLFAIRERTTDTVLFLGRLERPE